MIMSWWFSKKESIILQYPELLVAQICAHNKWNVFCCAFENSSPHNLVLKRSLERLWYLLTIFSHFHAASSIATTTAVVVSALHFTQTVGGAWRVAVRIIQERQNCLLVWWNRASDFSSFECSSPALAATDAVAFVIRPVVPKDDEMYLHAWTHWRLTRAFSTQIGSDGLLTREGL